MGGSELATAVIGATAVAVSGGVIQALAPALAGDRVDPVQHSRALSGVFTIGDLASAIAPPLAFWLMPLTSIGLIYRLCAGVFGVMGLLIPAAGCVLAAVLGGAGAMAYRYTNSGVTAFDSRPRGKGPYRQTLCSPDMQFIGLAKDLADQLHETAEKEAGQVEWEEYRRHRDAASAAVTAGEMVEAGREFLRAATFMMGQLKRQKEVHKDADRAAGLF